MSRLLFTLSAILLLASSLAVADPIPAAKGDKGVRTFKPHKSNVWSLSATADEKLLVTAEIANANPVRCWKFPDMEEQKSLDFFGIHKCLISPDGRWAVTTGPRSKKFPGLIIWDAQTWKPVHRIDDRAMGLALSPDNRLIASTDEDGRITARLLESGKVVFRTEPLGSGPGHLCFAPDSRFVYATFFPGPFVTCFDAETGKKYWRSDRGYGGFLWVDASADGRFVVTGGGGVFEQVSGRLYRGFRIPPDELPPRGPAVRIGL